MKKGDISLSFSSFFYPSNGAHIHNPTVHPTTVLGHPSPCSLLLVYSPSAISLHPFASLRLPFSPLFTPVWKLSETSENTENLLSVYSLPSFTSFLLIFYSPTPSSIHTRIHTHIQRVKFNKCSWQGYRNKVTIKNTHTHTHPSVCLKTYERIFFYSCGLRCYQVCHRYKKLYKNTLYS